MPTVSRFHGISIQMYFNEHGDAHFHAKHGEFSASYSVHGLRKLAGHLPNVQQKLVEAWAALYQARLIENAKRLARGEKVRKIPGLR